MSLFERISSAISFAERRAAMTEIGQNAEATELFHQSDAGQEKLECWFSSWDSQRGPFPTPDSRLETPARVHVRGSISSSEHCPKLAPCGVHIESFISGQYLAILQNVTLQPDSGRQC